MSNPSPAAVDPFTIRPVAEQIQVSRRTGRGLLFKRLGSLAFTVGSQIPARQFSLKREGAPPRPKRSH